MEKLELTNNIEISFKYEVLLIINNKNNLGLFSLCDNKERFLELLKKEHIKNNENKLIFNQQEYLFELNVKNIQGKEERYFHLKINFQDEKNLNKYIEFLKNLKKIYVQYEFEIEILRNDLDLYYSEKAYVLINKIENHMRKFIKYFLITKLGRNWIEESSPKEIEKAIKDKEDRDNEDKLKRLDFIQLGSFLFDDYSKKNISDLQKLINTGNEIDKSKLIDFVQKSNWEKYFHKNMECDSKDLKENWEKLYHYRNSIAHNKDFTLTKLEDVERICKLINKELEVAFKKINEIKTEEIDKNNIANALNDNTKNVELSTIVENLLRRHQLLLKEMESKDKQNDMFKNLSIK